MLGRAPSTDVLNCASLTDLPVANRDSKELAGDAPGLAGSSVSGSRLRTAISDTGETTHFVISVSDTSSAKASFREIYFKTED